MGALGVAQYSITCESHFDVMQSAAVQELLAKCHPLGMFDAIATLAVASNMRELYRLVLVRLSRAHVLVHCPSQQRLHHCTNCLQSHGGCGLPAPQSGQDGNWAPSRVAQRCH